MPHDQNSASHRSGNQPHESHDQNPHSDWSTSQQQTSHDLSHDQILKAEQPLPPEPIESDSPAVTETEQTEQVNTEVDMQPRVELYGSHPSPRVRQRHDVPPPENDTVQPPAINKHSKPNLLYNSPSKADKTPHSSIISNVQVQPAASQSSPKSVHSTKPVIEDPPPHPTAPVANPPKVGQPVSVPWDKPQPPSGHRRPPPPPPAQRNQTAPQDPQVSQRSPPRQERPEARPSAATRPSALKVDYAHSAGFDHEHHYHHHEQPEGRYDAHYQQPHDQYDENRQYPPEHQQYPHEHHQYPPENHQQYPSEQNIRGRYGEIRAHRQLFTESQHDQGMYDIDEDRVEGRRFRQMQPMPHQYYMDHAGGRPAGYRPDLKDIRERSSSGRSFGSLSSSDSQDDKQTPIKIPGRRHLSSDSPSEPTTPVAPMSLRDASRMMPKTRISNASYRVATMSDMNPIDMEPTHRDRAPAPHNRHRPTPSRRQGGLPGHVREGITQGVWSHYNYITNDW